MKSFVFAALVVCTVPAGLAAHQDAKPTTGQAAKPATAPPSVVGQWMLTMAGMPGGSLSTLELKADPKDSKKVVGTITGRTTGTVSVKGSFSNGKLKFSLDFDMGGGTLEVDFEGKFTDDDTLTGTAILSMLNQDLSWTATRVKDK